MSDKIRKFNFFKIFHQEIKISYKTGKIIYFKKMKNLEIPKFLQHFD